MSDPVDYDWYVNNSGITEDPAYKIGQGDAKADEKK